MHTQKEGQKWTRDVLDIVIICISKRVTFSEQNRLSQYIKIGYNLFLMELNIISSIWGPSTTNCLHNYKTVKPIIYVFTKYYHFKSWIVAKQHLGCQALFFFSFFLKQSLRGLKHHQIQLERLKKSHQGQSPDKGHGRICVFVDTDIQNVLHEEGKTFWSPLRNNGQW